MKITFVEKVILRETSLLSLCCQKLTGKHFDSFLRNKICHILYIDGWTYKKFAFYNEYSPEFIAANVCVREVDGDVTFISSGREYGQVWFWRGRINDVRNFRTRKVLPAIWHSIDFLYRPYSLMARYNNSYYYNNSVMVSKKYKRSFFDWRSGIVKSARKCPISNILPFPKKIILSAESKLWQELAKLKEKNKIIFSS